MPLSVRELLPHEPPMVLLDEVLGCEQGQTTTALTITSTSPFYIQDQGIPSYVGLEYMAQTCGVYAGLEATKMGLSVRMGYLLGTRNYHAATELFQLNDRLIVKATEVFQQDGMAVFDCSITKDNEEVASAQLTLYQPADTSSELQGSLES